MKRISLYLAHSYALNIIFFMMILLSIILIFDVLEIMRRLNEDKAGFFTIITMGLLKLPDVGQIILPFAVLFSAMFTFWQLNRRQELVILRSTGLSAWQFLLPFLVTAGVVGMLQIALINPMSAILLNKYERYEQTYLSRDDNIITALNEGLWLRQTLQQQEIIIHSRHIKPQSWTFEDVSVFIFDENQEFSRRIDAPLAILDEGKWHFKQAVIHYRQHETEQTPDLVLSTNLSPQDIENSFASVETRSFWDLYSLITQLHNAGFDTTRLRIHFHSLLSLPLLFIAMVSIAAVISLKPTNRSGGTLRMVMIGIVTGFVIFFITNFLKALGASNQMPILMAAWSPSLVTLMIGFGILFNTEDG